MDNLTLIVDNLYRFDQIKKEDNKYLKTDIINIVFDNNSCITEFSNINTNLPILLQLISKVKNITKINIIISYPTIKELSCDVSNIHKTFSKIHKPQKYKDTFKTFVNLNKYIKH